MILFVFIAILKAMEKPLKMLHLFEQHTLFQLLVGFTTLRLKLSAKDEMGKNMNAQECITDTIDLCFVTTTRFLYLSCKFKMS